MKIRVLLCILAGTMILACGTASVYSMSSAAGKGYVDVDGNGICDNCTNRTICPQDGTGMKRGNNGGVCGTNFVDADDDAICDNRADGTVHPQDGTGRKQGYRGKGTDNQPGENYAERTGSMIEKEASDAPETGKQQGGYGNGKRHGYGKQSG